MSFKDAHDSDDMMSEINMTPLVDVMLVLLIIFLITVPVLQHTTRVDLPSATNQAKAESDRKFFSRLCSHFPRYLV